MLKMVSLVTNYVHYCVTALNGKGHGIHSPFVYDFVIHVLDKKKYIHTGFKEIEKIRKKLLKSNQLLDVLDLGAGSKFGSSRQRSIGSIAASAAKPAKYAQLLYRMVKHYNISSVLELGTSLGITTRYLSLAGPANGVVSIEGAPTIAAFTADALKAEGFEHIKLVVGDFNDKLTPVLEGLRGRKLIFVDGNHSRHATLQYFSQILQYVSEDDIVVFDDIRWSEEMEHGWKEIIKYEQVTCSIDLFFVGVVLFRKEFKEKLDFTIRF